MFQWAVLRQSRLVPTSAALVHIKDVRIASPCTSDWAKMTGDDRVRHCAECNLNVYNFAAMTGFEIAELLANRQGGRVCARIYRRADGTMITQDCPKGLRAVVRRVSRVAGAAFAAAMSLNSAIAQTSSHASAPQQQKKGESLPTGEITFTVVDPQGATVAGVVVTLNEMKNGRHEKDKKAEPEIRLKAATDSGGVVRFTGLRPGVYEVNAVSRYLKSLMKTVAVKDHLAEQLKMVIDPSRAETVNLGVVVESDAPPIETMPIDVTNNLPAVWKAGPPARKSQAEPDRQ